MTSTLRRQIENDLGRSEDLTPLDLRIGPDLWRLYGGIGPGNQVDNVATRYLIRLARVGGVEPAVGAAIADAMADAVAEATISSSSCAAFFRRWMREFRALWTPHVAIRWFKSQLDDVAAVRACGDAVQAMLLEIWTAWTSEHEDDPRAIFSDRRWGPILRRAIEEALGPKSGPSDLDEVAEIDPEEAPTTIEMEPAQSVADANIFEEA